MEGWVVGGGPVGVQAHQPWMDAMVVDASWLSLIWICRVRVPMPPPPHTHTHTLFCFVEHLQCTCLVNAHTVAQALMHDWC